MSIDQSSLDDSRRDAMQVKAQPLNDKLPWKKDLGSGKEEKPLPVGKLMHPSQLLGNASLGLPLQFGGCDSCGATNIEECEGTWL